MEKLDIMDTDLICMNFVSTDLVSTDLVSMDLVSTDSVSMSLVSTDLVSTDLVSINLVITGRIMKKRKDRICHLVAWVLIWTEVHLGKVFMALVRYYSRTFLVMLEVAVLVV